MVTTSSLGTRDGSDEPMVGDREQMMILARDWRREELAHGPNVTYRVVELDDRGVPRPLDEADLVARLVLCTSELAARYGQ